MSILSPSVNMYICISDKGLNCLYKNLVWSLDKVETDLLIIYILTIECCGTVISLKPVQNKKIFLQKDKAVSHVRKYP